MSEKTKQLKDMLFNKKENGIDFMTEDELNECDDFCEGYKEFLAECKTEREVAAWVEDIAQANGFQRFDEFGGELEPGAKVYYMNRGKSIILCVKGKRSIKDGVRISAAHIDSPRIDLKQCPVYELDGLGYFKTHYYGGIKKYQWTAIPLSLHGRICKNDGSFVDVRIGEEAGEPKFCITDILPHLGADQMSRKANELVKGEELNVVIGSRPFKDDEESERIKLNLLSLLYEKYGIVERDFLSAELELVPAFTVDDIGFDRSLIGGYGHDDRVCSYPALQAILNIDDAPEYTAITVLTDKEETGSDGNTGLNSSYLKYFIEDLARLEGYEGRDVLRNSKCLSADVNAAYDPTWSSPFEKNNTSFINNGVCVTKFTGSRGKSGTSDASAEYVSWVKSLLEENHVLWQSGELGKVDAGGGGTVAMYIANMDVDTIDVGVPVLSMHSPYEIVSKIDVYMAYKAFLTFFTK
ncbi:aminopeptidase [uncultured Eubacterium sp.]|uniref:aminopeptidase n=1 Tax=uncultured Eubacterium sp. TaxID=165185 RepID=UPI0025DA56CA|nr:aminopeptidase [uncultured Eubacterium sp.]